MFKKVIKKYNELSLATRASFWFVVCNLLLKGISFFSTPIFARLLSDEEFGRLSVMLSFQELLLLFATWEIQLGTYQRGIYKFKNEIETYTTATQAFANLLTILFCVLCFLFFPKLQMLTGLSPQIMVLFAVYFFVRPSYDCWLIRKRSAYKYRQAVTVTLLFSLVNVVVPMIALLLVERTAEIKIGSTLIASTVICLFTYLPHANYLQLIGRRLDVKEYWRFTIHFLPPLMLNGLSYIILSQSDRVMIERMVGASQAAYYSVAYNIATTIIIIQNAIDQAAVPWRYQKLEEKKYADIRKVSSSLSIGVGFLILIFILISPEVITFLFPETYREAIWCIPPISVSVFFLFLYSLFVSFETYYEKTKYVMYVSVLFGAINVLLNYFCIHKFGYISCAYTTLFSYIGIAIGHYCFARKTIRDNAGNISVIDIKLICLVSVVLLIASVAITLIYPYYYIRYAFLLVLISILWFNRHRIISVVNQLKNR